MTEETYIKIWLSPEEVKEISKQEGFVMLEVSVLENSVTKFINGKLIHKTK